MPFWNIDRMPFSGPVFEIGDRVTFAQNLAGKYKSLAEKLARELGDGPYIVVAPESISKGLAKETEHVHVRSPTRMEYVPRALLALEDDVERRSG